MGAQGIIEMEGKKTRIVNIKVIQRCRLLHECMWFIVFPRPCCNFYHVGRTRVNTFFYKLT